MKRWQLTPFWVGVIFFLFAISPFPPRSPCCLARLGGHVSYWFGWYAFYPKTEVYTE